MFMGLCGCWAKLQWLISTFRDVGVLRGSLVCVGGFVCEKLAMCVSCGRGIT